MNGHARFDEGRAGIVQDFRGALVVQNKQFGRCAVYGVLVWLAYALVEFCMMGPIPLIGTRDAVVVTGFWRSNALLAVGYSVFGGLLGLVSAFAAGLLQRRAEPAVAATCRRLSVLTLLAAFVANAMIQPQIGRVNLVCASTGLLIALFVLLSLHPRLQWEVGDVGPWTASLMLMAPAWMVAGPLREEGILTRIGALAGWLGVCFLLHIAVKLYLDAPFRRAVPSWALRQAILAVVVGAPAAIACVLFSSDLETFSASEHQAASADERPNIVLVVLDTVRADHLSLYGYRRRTTPFLEQLANEAHVFERLTAASDMTLPSHASIFTGLYPSWHHAHFSRPSHPWGRPLAEETETLAERLTAHGYISIGVSANDGVVQPRYGLDQGFQWFDARHPIPLVRLWHGKLLLRWRMRELLDVVVDMHEFDRDTRSAADINRDVATQLRASTDHPAPLFLFVNYMDAHAPYVPPAPFDSLYKDDGPAFDRADYHAAQIEVMGLQRDLSTEERDFFISRYDGAIRYLDTQLEALIGLLKAAVRYENTLLIVTSDHGEAFGERHRIGHAGGSTGQDQLFVPLLIKYPHSSEAHKEQRSVSHVDLLPTILNVAGIDVPPGLPGQNLRSMAPPGSRVVLAEAFSNAYYANWHPRLERNERAIIRWPMKYIQREPGRPEFYDLAADPLETHNIADNSDPAQQRIRELMSALLASAPQPDKRVRKLGQDTLQRLRGLGYIQ